MMRKTMNSGGKFEEGALSQTGERERNNTTRHKNTNHTRPAHIAGCF